MNVLTRLTLCFALLFSTASHAMAPVGGGGYFFMLVALVLIGIILLLLWMFKFLKGIRHDCKQHDAEQKD